MRVKNHKNKRESPSKRMHDLYYRPVYFDKKTYEVLQILAKMHHQSIKMFTYNIVQRGLRVYAVEQVRLDMKLQEEAEKQGKPRPRPSPFLRWINKLQDEWEQKRKKELRDERKAER
jgi:hypothetical protein